MKKRVQESITQPYGTSFYKYGLLKYPEKYTEKGQLEPLVHSSQGIECEKEISNVDILPMDMVTGLTLEELRFLPIWKNNICIFVMVDTKVSAVGTPAIHRIVKYAYSMNRDHNKNLPIEKIIQNHLVRRRNQEPSLSPENNLFIEGFLEKYLEGPTDQKVKQYQ